MKLQDLNNSSFTKPIIFSNSNDDILECFSNMEVKIKHSWASDFGIRFNGKLEFFKTFEGLQKRSNVLIEKYNLILQ